MSRDPNLHWKERGDGLIFLVQRYHEGTDGEFDHPVALIGDFSDCWTFSSTLFRGYALDRSAASVAVLSNLGVKGFV